MKRTDIQTAVDIYWIICCTDSTSTSQETGHKQTRNHTHLLKGLLWSLVIQCTLWQTNQFTDTAHLHFQFSVQIRQAIRYSYTLVICLRMFPTCKHLTTQSVQGDWGACRVYHWDVHHPGKWEEMGKGAGPQLPSLRSDIATGRTHGRSQLLEM